MAENQCARICHERQMVYLPFAELFERWSNDTPALHHTVSAHPDISQVPSDDAVIHNNSLKERIHTHN